MRILRDLAAVLVLGVLATVLAGCGSDSSGNAGHELSFAERLAKTKREPRADVRAKELVRIAIEQSKASDPIGAEDTMVLAIKACRQVEDPAARTVAFSLLAEAHHRLGNPTQSGRAASAALSAAGKVESVEIRARCLARAGRALGTVGNTARAAGALTEAEQQAAQLDDTRGRVLVLVEIAAGLQKIDRPSEADRVVGAALALANSIEDDRQRCEALFKVAAQQHAMQKKEAAATFDLALESAGKIQSAHSRAYALADVAEELSRAGRHAKTHQVLKEADAVAQRIRDAAIGRQMLGRIRGLKAKLPRDPAAG